MNKNIQITITERMKANTRFAGILSLLSLAALGGVVLLTAYTVRLDIAFMEANAMLKNDMIRDDILSEAFSFDNYFPLFIPLGLLANAMIAAIFGLSQEHYFKRYRQALQKFSETLTHPHPHHLGPLQGATQDFFTLLELKAKVGSSQEFIEKKNQLLGHWPKGAKTYFLDQVQFAVIAGGLAAYFSALCMIIFWHANSKIVTLSSNLAHYHDINAPTFFNFQLGISEAIGWTFVVVVTLLSSFAGVRFSKSTSFASYAIMRQMRLFIDGHYATRITLRKGDPGSTEVKAMNEALSRIEQNLNSKPFG